MRAITVYEASDGSRWDSEAEARRQEEVVAAVADALAPLGPRHEAPGCNYENGHGYVRHDPATVEAVRRALLPMTRKALDWWWSEQITHHGKAPDDCHPSWYCRLLDGPHDAPLVEAWGRMTCIDREGREWGQPYYSEHPDEAEAFEIEGEDRP